MSGKVVIPKCCQLREAYLETDGLWTCAPEDASSMLSWHFDFYTEASQESQVDNFLNYELHPEPLGCPETFFVDRFFSEEYGQEFFLQTDGTLKGDGWPEGQDFCVDYEVEHNSTGYPVVSMCLSEDTMDYDRVGPILFPIGQIISVLFLLLTLLAFLLIPEKRSLHGKIVINHIVSLFSLYVLLTVTTLVGGSLHGTPCKGLGILLHYFFLASFSWLTVICFDMWRNFNNLTSSFGRSSMSGKRSLLLYCLSAWGGPALFLTISVIIDVSGDPKSMLKPNYGKGICWIFGKYAVLVYNYCPIAILIVINIVFFVLTAMIIHRSQKETHFARRETLRCRKQQKREKQRFVLFIKLSLVMGICWVMEVVARIFQDFLHVHKVYFYATDFVNSIQGVLIFVVVVCKRDTLIKLAKRFPAIPTCLHIDTPPTSSDALTTSQSKESKAQEVQDDPV